MLLTWLTVDQCCKYVTSGLAGEFVGGVQEDISVLDEIEKRCYQLAQSHYLKITIGERCCTEMVSRYICIFSLYPQGVISSLDFMAGVINYVLSLLVLGKRKVLFLLMPT